ncbi:unnamed protein product [Porites evermanni]|uniref:Peptidase M12B domain-containing protein n=1 Tax=Porites evermanni TaxID=104178 RepID=A0ABN8R8H9_9CNID|nr:unnamed protein product [Porites evermanni]
MMMPILVLAISCFAWQIPRGENRATGGESTLHNQMTRGEIKHYFGVQHWMDVPEYEVTFPFERDEKGGLAFNSLNHRRLLKRGIDDKGNGIQYNYHLNAFGEQLRLHVKRNTKFMAPDLQLESRDQDGRRTTRPVSENTFYVTGQVDSEPDSLVALSVRDGMTGFIKRSRDAMVVHPLPEHLALQFRNESEGIPHVVYKRPLQEDFECHTKMNKFSKRGLNQQLEDANSNEGLLIDKYLEVALLADEHVVSAHGNKTEEFLLLLGSIVNSIFNGVTVGNIKINYVITRLVLITNEELGVDPSNSGVSQVTVIQKLEAWARDNNRNNASDPLQFDVASLVRSAGIGGVAVVYNSVCRHNDLVNVNSDNGLQTAYKIAHETAHNLGVDHDGNADCPNYVNIMSSTLIAGPGALKWSSCSRAAIQTFLSSDDSFCLDDVPSSTRPIPPESYYTRLPGELVDADTQCEYDYGTGYRRCPHINLEDSCEALHCTRDGYKCLSSFILPLEGTPCGMRKWCIKGACVDNGTPKTDGGWTEWSDYTTCSPSCEGGVRYRERTCTNPAPQNGGQNCAGPSKAHWEICNSYVACPPTQSTYRNIQCQEIDSTLTFYHISSVSACTLTCRSGNSVRTYGNVADGTRCDHQNPFVYDVCINGQCQSVGCDHVMSSGKVKDRCGVCGGDGDSCTLVKSTYTENYIQYAYSPVDTIVELPVHSANAVFEERSKTYNLIGVQDEEGNDLIPIPSWWGKVVYKAGTKITYINDAKFPDRLEIEGPTNMPLRIVFAHLSEANVGIDYQYLRPLGENESPESATCSWVTSNWTDCTTGQQTREVLCVRSDNDTGQTAASVNCCGEESKPNSVNLCYSWHTDDWQACTKTCGKGTQSRSVVCRAKLNDTHYDIDESEFLCNITLKPMTFRSSCNDVNCPATWKTYWPECSKLCLTGNRTREVKCSRINELGQDEDVSDIQCEYESPPPAITESCNSDNPCKEYEIGCFKTPQDLFSETLGDFTQEADASKTLMECKELTKQSGYNVFALGHGGLCMSGPNAQDTYYRYKPASKKNKCSNGIGIGDHSVVYTFEPLPKFEAVGCYKDSSSRALPTLYANFRPFIDWYNMDATIRQCALVARDMGYKYFAVQFYGECWSSWDASENYDKYGNQTKTTYCWANVGGPMTNYVYRFPYE